MTGARTTLVRMVSSSMAVGVVWGFSACLDPTQITLNVKTDVPCASSKGVAFTGGKPGAVERAPSSTVTMDCNAGDIGTLVATPTDDKDVAAAFLVVQGVDRPVAECAAAGFKGCIVQRRILRYLSHTPLTLPIQMHLVCKDQACGEFETCNRYRQCVSATIASPDQCADGECWPEGDGREGGNTGDASTVDGPTGDGANTDGSSDGPKTDAGKDVFQPPLGKLYCPTASDPEAVCSAGSICCWSRTGAYGQCVAGTTCPGTEMPMACNREEDCGGGRRCCGRAVAVVPPPPPLQELPSADCKTPGVDPCSLWLCLADDDCPTANALPMHCERKNAHFTPQDTMGECVAGAPPVDRNGSL